MSRTIPAALASLALLVATPAYAATITLSPSTVTVVQGQTFTVLVDVDPQGAKLYTVKVNMSYPASLIEVTNFTIDSSWPLTPPGNSVNNVSGTLSETAGFTGGFTAVKRFGTMTVRAKANGTATISVSTGSGAYDSQSANKLSGTQGSTVATIAAPAPAEPEPEPTAETPEPTQTPAVTETRAPVRTTPVATAGGTETEGEATTTAIAAGTGTEEQAAAAGFLGNNWKLLAVALVLIVGTGAGAWYMRRRTF